MLLKYNEAITQYGSSGTKFVFNQILANNTRIFEAPYRRPVCSEGCWLINFELNGYYFRNFCV